MLKELIYKGNYEELENKLHTRKTEISEEVNKAVSEIINNVRENGDDALKEYCAKFDGFHVSRKDDFIVSKHYSRCRTSPSFISAPMIRMPGISRPPW